LAHERAAAAAVCAACLPCSKRWPAAAAAAGVEAAQVSFEVEREAAAAENCSLELLRYFF